MISYRLYSVNIVYVHNGQICQWWIGMDMDSLAIHPLRPYFFHSIYEENFHRVTFDFLPWKKNLGSNTRGNFSSNDRLTGSVKRFIDRTYPFRKIAISRHGLFTMSKLAIWVTINNKYYGSILFMFRSGKMNVEEILGHKSSVKTLLSSEVDLKNPV